MRKRSPGAFGFADSVSSSASGGECDALKSAEAGEVSVVEAR